MIDIETLYFDPKRVEEVMGRELGGTAVAFLEPEYRQAVVRAAFVEYASRLKAFGDFLSSLVEEGRVVDETTELEIAEMYSVNGGSLLDLIDAAVGFEGTHSPESLGILDNHWELYRPAEAEVFDEEGEK